MAVFDRETRLRPGQDVFVAKPEHQRFLNEIEATKLDSYLMNLLRKDKVLQLAMHDRGCSDKEFARETRRGIQELRAHHDLNDDETKTVEESIHLLRDLALQDENAFQQTKKTGKMYAILEEACRLSPLLQTIVDEHVTSWHEFFDNVNQTILGESLERLVPQVMDALETQKPEGVVIHRLEKAIKALELDEDEKKVLGNAVAFMQAIKTHNIRRFKKSGVNEAYNKFDDLEKKIEKIVHRISPDDVEEQRRKRFENAQIPHAHFCAALDELCQELFGMSLRESDILQHFSRELKDQARARGFSYDEIKKLDRMRRLVNEDFTEHIYPSLDDEEIPDGGEFLEWIKNRKINVDEYETSEKEIREWIERIENARLQSEGFETLVPAPKRKEEIDPTALATDEQHADYLEETLTSLLDPFDELFPKAVQRVRAGEVGQGVGDIRTALKKLTLKPKEKEVLANVLNRLVEVLAKDELRKPKTIGDVERESVINAQFLAEFESIVNAISTRMADEEGEIQEGPERRRLSMARAWLKRKIGR